MTVRLGQELMQPDKRSDELRPGLYVVSTPIGNLRDISLRALDVLQAVHYILAEDTRHSAQLLRAYGVKTNCVSYNDHNGAMRRPKIIEDLRDGRSIAIISDAGTPLISDPGWKLVEAIYDEGFDVFPIPGASAIMAALVKSGMPPDRFYFGGFLPPKRSARLRFLSEISSLKATLIFFESPKRIADSLESIEEVFGNDCDVSVVRELTKRFEAVIKGKVREVSELASSGLKGECVICVRAEGFKHAQEQIDTALSALLGEVHLKTAAKLIADLGLCSRSEAYKRGLKILNK